MPTEVVVLSMLRAIVEVAGFAMLGQGLLYVLAGRRRKENFVYQLFGILTRPVIRFTRWITPRFVRDDHVPFAAFLLLLWLWIGLLIAKRYVCLAQALACPGV
jgi:hypothetical protein